MRIFKKLKNVIKLEDLVSVLCTSKVEEHVCKSSDVFNVKTLLVPIESDNTLFVCLNKNSLSNMLELSEDESEAILEKLYINPVSCDIISKLADTMLELKSAREIAAAENLFVEEPYSVSSVDSIASKVLYYSSNAIGMDNILKTFGSDCMQSITENCISKKDVHKFREKNMKSKEFKILIDLGSRFFVVDSSIIGKMTNLEQFKIALAIHATFQVVRQSVDYVDVLTILVEELKKSNA